MKIKHILVPVDFSEYSDKAVEYALFLAETQGARVTLMHAIVLHQHDINEEAHLQEYEAIVKKKEQESYRQLRQQNKHAETRGITIESRIVRGVSAADCILEFVQKQTFDLLVIGSHGRTGFKKWIYGSVAEKVLRLSPVPVLTTHHSLKKFVLDKILVPIDFSDYSKESIHVARDLAKHYNSQLIFLHVVEQPLYPAFYATSSSPLFVIDPRLREDALKKLRDFTGVEDMKGSSEYSTVNIEHLVLEGTVYQEIVGFAEEKKVDLIVMATRGLTGMEHLLVGSNAERVVRLASSPVLTLGRN